MLKKSLQLAIALFLIGNSSFAQWGGSTTTTGDTYRDGNVGIGTTTPRALLSFGANNAGKKLLVYDDITTNVQAGFGTDMSNIGGRELSIFHPTSDGVDGKISFGRILQSTGAYSETMRITGAGNVGIGTTNPGSFKLAVEGKIGAREVHVTAANPWPDYVFAQQYKLKSLSSLEEYISKNNRLPNMPSAEEVKNNGIELGQINTRVVEKIEELTLYIIAMNKKIEKLEKDNAELRNQLKK